MTITFDYPLWAMTLAVLFALAWLIQFVLQLVIWLRPLRHARQARRQSALTEVGTDAPGVSIIVYSRNAAESLARNLPALLEQQYPTFEVIVLDDDSCDDTADVLSMMEQRSDRFFHTRIDKRTRAMSHRKLGMLLGTKIAHYDLILMTHAECHPASPLWISNMVRHFRNPATEVVLGPVVYERRQSLLSRFCQFDLMQRLLWLLGVTLSVRSFAGWGQNMAFRKSTFYANRSQGFQRHLNIQPGEDDLFVADVARDGNVAVEALAASVMTDQSKPLFINWSLERLNRGFTSRLYNITPAVIKVIDGVSRWALALCALALMVYALFIIVTVPGLHPVAWSVFGLLLLLIGVRMGLMAYTYTAIARIWGQKPFVVWPILLDLYMPLVDIWFRLKALLHRKSFGVGHIGLR